MVVTPENAVSLPLAGFRLYWTFISEVRKPIARKPICQVANIAPGQRR